MSWTQTNPAEPGFRYNWQFIASKALFGFTTGGKDITADKEPHHGSLWVKSLLNLVPAPHSFPDACGLTYAKKNREGPSEAPLGLSEPNNCTAALHSSWKQ